MEDKRKTIRSNLTKKPIIVRINIGQYSVIRLCTILSVLDLTTDAVSDLTINNLFRSNGTHVGPYEELLLGSNGLVEVKYRVCDGLMKVAIKNLTQNTLSVNGWVDTRLSH